MSSATTPAPARTRTVTWSDPRILLDAFSAGKTGLELLEGIVSGALPQAPIVRPILADTGG